MVQFRVLGDRGGDKKLQPGECPGEGRLQHGVQGIPHKRDCCRRQAHQRFVWWLGEQWFRYTADRFIGMDGAVSQFQSFEQLYGPKEARDLRTSTILF